MEAQNQDINHRWQIRAAHNYLIVVALAGIAALMILVRIPGDPRFAWFLGLSRTRWGMMLILILGACGLIFFDRLLSRKPALEEKILTRVIQLLNRDLFYFSCIAVSIALGVVAANILWLTRALSDALVHGYLERLMPFVLWIGTGACMTILVLPMLRYGKPRPIYSKTKTALQASAIFFVVFIGIVIVIAMTKIGIDPDANGWGTPAAPLLNFQVGAIVGLGVLFLLGESVFLRKNRGAAPGLRLDLFISIVLWSLAFGIWMREPLNPSYFAPAPRAPNYEVYPYSDAAYYDSIANQLVIGEGFPGVSMKPLYTIFLAAGHGIFGNTYNSLLIFQIGILAFLPVVLYWLAKKLHHRISGLLAAGFLILREKNSIALSGKILVSHSKLLMSDDLAALGMLLLVLVIVIWLGTNRNPGWAPIAIGGILGALSLLRPQMIVMTLAVLILFGLVYYRRPLSGILNAFLFFLGLGLMLFPWLWRSRELTGSVVINSPDQMAWMTQVYHLNPGTYFMSQNPGESKSAYAQRINQYLKQFVLEHPMEVARFTLAHFAHNEVSMLVSLPMSWQVTQDPNTTLYYYQNGAKWTRLWEECCSAAAFVKTMPFWKTWQGSLNGDMVAAMLFNILAIAVGFGVMLVRRDILGWVPLGFALIYNLSVALGRYSGWRFLLPMDWSTFLYYAVGIGQLLLWGKVFLSGNKNLPAEPQGEQENIQVEPHRRTLLVSVVVSMIVVAFGLTSIFFEYWVPEKYESISKQAVIAMLDTSDFYRALQNNHGPSLDEFLQNDSVVAIEGRALYPRFYPALEGEPGGEWIAFKPQPYNRLGFILVGPQGAQVILKLDQPPDNFPHAADVVVLGCLAGDYIDAWVVVLQDHTILPSVGAETLTCPVP